MTDENSSIQQNKIKIQVEEIKSNLILDSSTCASSTQKKQDSTKLDGRLKEHRIPGYNINGTLDKRYKANEEEKLPQSSINYSQLSK